MGDRALDLYRWQRYPEFTGVADTTQRIHFDGHVEGGAAKPRGEQEARLGARELEMAKMEDVEAAFMEHYIAERAPLFRFYQDRDYGYLVCTAGGVLSFDRDGLVGKDIVDAGGVDDVAVAAALPGIKK